MSGIVARVLDEPARCCVSNWHDIRNSNSGAVSSHSYLKQPLHASLLGPRILAPHGNIPDCALRIHRRCFVYDNEALLRQRSELLFLIAQLLHNHWQGPGRLLRDMLGLLQRQPRQQVAESSKPSIHQHSML